MDAKKRILNFYLTQRLDYMKKIHASDSYQQGGAVVTRNQAKNTDNPNTKQIIIPVISQRKRKFEDVVPEDNKRKKKEEEIPSDQPQSPLAGPSNENKSPATSDNNNDDLMDYEREDGSEIHLFDTVTKIYEDNNLEVNVIKEMFRRQKVFSIEDHSFVMRIKLKNKTAPKPMLISLMDVLQTAFTFMINNLKTFLSQNQDEKNLIYLTIHQDGMRNGINSGSFYLQSVQTKELVKDVLFMFERFVNSDSTISVFDNSFKCFFRVVSVPHVHYSKNRRKAPTDFLHQSRLKKGSYHYKQYSEKVPSRLGCRLNRRFRISEKSGLLDFPGDIFFYEHYQIIFTIFYFALKGHL